MITGQDPTKLVNGFEFPVLDFSGGLNTKSSQYLLGRDTNYSLRRNQLTLLENVDRNESGALTTRFGYAKLNTDVVVPAGGDDTIRSIYEYRKTDGTNLVIINAGNSLYKFVSPNFTLIGTVTTADKRFSWTSMNNLLIGCNGVDDPIKYDGTTLAALGGTPPTGPSVVAYYREHIFFAKDLTLHYSAINAPEDYTTVGDAGSVPVPSVRGTKVTALLAFFDRLIVFTDYEVFGLTGTNDDDFAFTPISYEFGHTGSHDAVVPAGNNDVYFCSEQGVHRLNVTDATSELGNLQESYASASIEPTWQAISALNLGNIVAINNQQESQVIFLIGSDNADNNVAYVADYYHRDGLGSPTWGKYTNHPFYSIGGTHILTSGVSDILYGGFDGFVYRRTGNLDILAEIPVKFSYTTDADNPQWNKLFRWINLFVENIDSASSTTEPFTVTASCDFGARTVSNTPDVTVIGGKRLGIDWVLGVDPWFTPKLSTPKISIPCIGRYLTLIFSFTSASRLTFNGFIIYGALRRLIV